MSCSVRLASQQEADAYMNQFRLFHFASLISVCVDRDREGTFEEGLEDSRGYSLDLTLYDTLQPLPG